MTIEQQISDLTVQTTALLTAVNVRKAALDKAVSDATVQATAAGANATSASAANATAAQTLAGTTSAAAQAANARDQAQAAWSAAMAPAEQLPVISQSIHSGTIVDAMIYDTSKDSDGGAWRKRTQHTSWYNEAINGKWLGQQANELVARGDNLVQYPEGPAAPLVDANVTDATYPIQGYSGAIQFGDNSVQRACVWSNYTTVANTLYALSFIVQMDDNSAPSITAATPAGDMTLIFNNSAVSVTNITVVQTATPNVYRVTAVTSATSAQTSHGIYKYTNQSAKGFRITAFKINKVGELPSTYSASPELIINGGFDAGTAGWTAGANDSVVDGKYRAQNGGAGTSATSGRQSFPTVVGKVYAVTGEITGYLGQVQGGIFVGIPGNAGKYGVVYSSTSQVVKATIVFVAQETSVQVTLSTNAFTANAYCDFDNVSVKEVTTLATPYVPYSQLAGSYYQNTTDGKFYALNSTYGQTEVFRGNTREFPAVAGIVGEAGRVVIYDLSKPDTPMWMAYKNGTGSNSMLGTSTVSSVFGANGVLYIGGNGGSGRLATLEFLTDIASSILTSTVFDQYCDGVANRHAYGPAMTTLKVRGKYYLVNREVNDVAVTVLPGAPIDPATGLPVPTVAVATAGGVSVLKHDGSVATESLGGAKHGVAFKGNDLYVFRGVSLSNIWYLRDVGSATNGFAYSPMLQAGSSGIPALFDSSPLVARGALLRNLIAHGTTNGLNLIQHNPVSRSNSMIAYITNAYNSGYQVGDIRGAWLSDTMAESITAPELVTNGTFVQDLTGWTVTAGAVVNVNGTGGVTATSASASNILMEQSIPTVVGKRYAVSITRTGGSDTLGIYIGGITGSVVGWVTTNTTATGTFVAVSANSLLRPVTGGGNQTVSFDNISVQEEAGVELVTNGGFTTNTNGWYPYAATASVENGEVLLTHGGSGARIEQPLTVVAGRQYILSGTARAGTGTGAQITVKRGAAGGYVAVTALPTVSSTTATTASVTFTAPGSDIIVQGTVYGSAGNTAYFDNISIREANNLVLNGTFDANTTGWATQAGGVLTWNSEGSVTLSNTSAAYGLARQTVPTVSGRTYSVSISVKNAVGNSWLLLNGQVMGASFSTNTGGTYQTYTHQFTATGSTINLDVQLANVVGNVVTFDNIVVKDVTELVTNGTFEGMTTGWTVDFGTLSNVNGKMRLTSNGESSAVRASQLLPTIVGKTYQVSADVIGGTTPASVGVNRAGAISMSQPGDPSESVAIGANKTVTHVFTATTTTSRIILGGTAAVGTYADFDNISVKLAEPDRSVKNKPLNIIGSLTKAPVASGAQLVEYSGFDGATNTCFLSQPHDAAVNDLPVGMLFLGWVSAHNSGNFPFAGKGNTSAFSWTLRGASGGELVLEVWLTTGGYKTINVPSFFDNSRIRRMVAAYFDGTTLAIVVDGVVKASQTYASDTIRSCSEPLTIGAGYYYGGGASRSAYPGATLALVRMSATVPSPDQFAQIYRDELPLFQPNAKCTIDGTSSQINALAYDDATDVLHVGTSWGRSAFVGLTRVESEAGNTTVLSASGGAIIAGASGARLYQPALQLRDELRRKSEARAALGKEPVFTDYDAIAAQTAFVIPKGYTVKAVYVGGVLKRAGSTKDYTVSYDGYKETVNFGIAPGSAAWISIMTVRS